MKRLCCKAPLATSVAHSSVPLFSPWTAKASRDQKQTLSLFFFFYPLHPKLSSAPAWLMLSRRRAGKTNISQIKKPSSPKPEPLTPYNHTFHWNDIIWHSGLVNSDISLITRRFLVQIPVGDISGVHRFSKTIKVDWRVNMWWTSSLHLHYMS